ncbi:uroporphyrinogen-III synthase [Rhodoblastus sp.]|uniref:uroporphyrinogen-III synthase n=1 Tax=Rhodoblastus sp. TaxID=1962975 RepID=UPI0035B4399C
MRVLVTRPSDQAARTAKRLAALGHQAILAPALEIVATGATLPDAAFDLILATSAQAFAGGPFPAAVRGAPLVCVGEKTAEAGREAGFAIDHVAPDAESLAERLIASRPPRSALYLAGRERKAALEQRLREAGWRLALVETYEARPATALPPEVRTALDKGEIDAILHYSPRSAGIALGLAGGVSAARLRHYCLSGEIAEICRRWAPDEKIFTAFQPDEESLLNLLGPSGRLARSDRA